MSEGAIKTDVKTAWTDLDVAAAGRVKAWLDHPDQKKVGMTQSALAREAGMNVSTLHGVLNLNYPSSPTRWLTRLTEAIQILKERTTRTLRIPFVETSIWRIANVACTRAQVYGAGSVLPAFVGTGKTESLREYQRRHEQVYIIESTPMMTADVLLNRLVEATGAEVVKTNPYGHTKGTKDQRTNGVIEKLKGSQALLVLDEADKTTQATLEYIRRITDLSGCGFVLAGTESLRAMVRDPEGRFGQISSRVSYWPEIIRGITEDDCKLLVDAALGKELDELTEDHYAAMWECCDGSARVLVRGLIPGVRDYILRKGRTLTGRAIIEVSQKVLGFEPRHKVRSWRGQRQHERFEKDAAEQGRGS